MKLLKTLAVLSILITSSTYAADTPLVKGLPDFTPLIDKYSSAVVNIVVTAPSSAFDDDMPPNPHSSVPHLPSPIVPPSKLPNEKSDDNTAHGEGSGCIITSDGYIITNAHVVEQATSVIVHLTNQREYKAKVIGSDTYSDIAVIKIDAKDLPTLTIGDSSKLRPGQWVMAIGSPFGFEGTATAGIVSAIARPTRDSVIPFIQTDVAINPGNSGGPLFNMNGELVGINSEIYTHTGGFEGISFAVPINIAMSVEQQLITIGHVVRGRLGIMIGDVNQQIADDAGLDRPRGSLITGIQPDGPASAGLKEHDIILSVNGVVINRSIQLPILVSNIKPGSVAQFQVIRNKKTISVPIKIGELKEPQKMVIPQERK